MKCFLAILSLLSFFTIVQGNEDDYAFYLKVDSGISASMPADIVASYPPWDQSTQGYNANLGNCAIAGLSVGCEFFHILDLDATIANRSIFQYRQFQTSTDGNGSYTREFDLSVTPILLTATILGRGISHLHHDFCDGKIYPILGAGIGVSNLLITNFRTTGLPPSGYSTPFNSFNAGNQYNLSKNFTYTALIGVEYSHTDRWAIGTGYRWFDAGSFEGPRYLRSANGSAIDVGADAWNMKFRANEWFIEFKIFI